MPLFEVSCPSPTCSLHRQRVERLLRHFEDPNPPCEACGGTTVRLISKPRLVWLRDLVFYDPPTGETARKDMERGSHMVARKRSKGGTLDKPVFEQIRTRKQQVDYCREEGLIDPAEIGKVEINKDGDKASTAGFSGQWY